MIILDEDVTTTDPIGEVRTFIGAAIVTSEVLTVLRIVYY